MSAAPQRGYHFATVDQWKACLFSQADTAVKDGATTVRPFTPYQSIAKPSFPSDGACAPAFSRVRESLWHDGSGRLLRLADGDDQPESVAAPTAIARAGRMIATSSDLWVAGDTPHLLQCFDAGTLSRRFTVELAPARVIDIAADARDGVVALVERNGVLEAVHVDCAGSVGTKVVLEGLSEARAFAYLRGLGQFAVLLGDGERIYWFGKGGGASLWWTQLARFAPCFVADAIASDARGRVFVAGTDEMGAAGSKSHVLVFDSEGVPVDDVVLHEAATGIASARDSLLVTGQGGLYRLSLADPVPDDVAEVRAMILTPAMEAPDVADGRRWLRAEVAGDLPPGASMEITWATTEDTAVRDELRAIAEDPSLAPGRRLVKIRAREGIWRGPVVFQSGTPAKAEVPFAAPLFEVHDRFVWVCITLAAGAGAKLPSVSRLSVLYPGRTLMENLPSIYQRAESQPASYLRALVGVLEATTQTLDARVAALGSRIHPRTAPPEWLDFVARWLGLPWDDALDPDAKKCIVAHAAQIAKGRGTRAGLETLLACLIPGTPPRFRITDLTADYGFATVGGDACRGSALPALLGGLPASAAHLDVQATLGTMRLPCEGAEEENETSRLIGKVRIDVAASAEDRARWSPWMEGVLSEMVPVTARLELRWLGIDALRDDRLGDTLTLDPPAAPRLGTDAVTGRSWLPDGAATLPTSGTGTGPTLH
jgi:phage tail-like protein